MARALNFPPRFYYVDERNADGSPAGLSIDGDAHAAFFYELATALKQSEPIATFVKGQGYKSFPRPERVWPRV